MRLNDPLVTSFKFEDNEYEIDLAFDNVMDVFDVLADESLRDLEKIEISLELLLDKPWQGGDMLGVWNYIYENFIHIENKQIIEYDLKGNPLPVQKEEKKSVDIDKDSEYIFASFKQAYNINLFKEQGKLHWHEFQALLNGLPSNTVMQRIIQIRLWKPSKGDSNEYKQSMRELQNVYTLDVEEYASL